MIVVEPNPRFEGPRSNYRATKRPVSRPNVRSVNPRLEHDSLVDPITGLGRRKIPTSTQKPGKTTNQALVYPRLLYRNFVTLTRGELHEGDVVFVSKHSALFGTAQSRMSRVCSWRDVNVNLQSVQCKLDPNNEDSKKIARRSRLLMLKNKNQKLAANVQLKTDLSRANQAIPDDIDDLINMNTDSRNCTRAYIKEAKKAIRKKTELQIHPEEDWMALPAIADWRVDGVLHSKELSDVDMSESYTTESEAECLMNVAVQGPCVVRNNSHEKDEQFFDDAAFPGDYLLLCLVYVPEDSGVISYCIKPASTRQLFDMMATASGVARRAPSCAPGGTSTGFDIDDLLCTVAAWRIGRVIDDRKTSGEYKTVEANVSIDLLTMEGLWDMLSNGDGKGYMEERIRIYDKRLMEIAVGDIRRRREEKARLKAYIEMMERLARELEIKMKLEEIRRKKALKTLAPGLTAATKEAAQRAKERREKIKEAQKKLEEGVKARKNAIRVKERLKQIREEFEEEKRAKAELEAKIAELAKLRAARRIQDAQRKKRLDELRARNAAKIIQRANAQARQRELEALKKKEEEELRKKEERDRRLKKLRDVFLEAKRAADEARRIAEEAEESEEQERRRVEQEAREAQADEDLRLLNEEEAQWQQKFDDLMRELGEMEENERIRREELERMKQEDEEIDRLEEEQLVRDREEQALRDEELRLQALKIEERQRIEEQDRLEEWENELARRLAEDAQTENELRRLQDEEEQYELDKQMFEDEQLIALQEEEELQRLQQQQDEQDEEDEDDIEIPYELSDDDESESEEELEPENVVELIETADMQIEVFTKQASDRRALMLQMLNVGLPVAALRYAQSELMTQLNELRRRQRAWASEAGANIPDDVLEIENFNSKAVTVISRPPSKQETLHFTLETNRQEAFRRKDLLYPERKPFSIRWMTEEYPWNFPGGQKLIGYSGPAMTRGMSLAATADYVYVRSRALDFETQMHMFDAGEAMTKVGYMPALDKFVEMGNKITDYESICSAYLLLNDGGLTHYLCTLLADSQIDGEQAFPYTVDKNRIKFSRPPMIDNYLQFTTSDTGELMSRALGSTDAEKTGSISLSLNILFDLPTKTNWEIMSNGLGIRRAVADSASWLKASNAMDIHMQDSETIALTNGISLTWGEIVKRALCAGLITLGKMPAPSAQMIQSEVDSAGLNLVTMGGRALLENSTNVPDSILSLTSQFEQLDNTAVYQPLFANVSDAPSTVNLLAVPERAGIPSQYSNYSLGNVQSSLALLGEEAGSVPPLNMDRRVDQSSSAYDLGATYIEPQDTNQPASEVPQTTLQAAGSLLGSGAAYVAESALQFTLGGFFPGGKFE